MDPIIKASPVLAIGESGSSGLKCGGPPRAPWPLFNPLHAADLWYDDVGCEFLLQKSCAISLLAKATENATTATKKKNSDSSSIQTR